MGHGAWGMGMGMGIGHGALVPLPGGVRGGFLKAQCTGREASEDKAWGISYQLFLHLLLHFGFFRFVEFLIFQ
jgi:hypothetical protein